MDKGQRSFIFTDGTSSYIGNGSKKTSGLSGRFSNWCDELHLKLTKNLFEYKGGNFELLGKKGEAYVLIFPVYRHEDFRVQFQS